VKLGRKHRALGTPRAGGEGPGRGGEVGTDLLALSSFDGVWERVG